MTDPEQIASSVVGSASVPFFFPPRNMSKFGVQDLLVDAGFTWNLNMESGIQECYKIDGITKPSQIIVDVINLSPDELAVYNYNETEEEYLLLKHDECLRLAKESSNLQEEHPNCTFHIIPFTIQNYLRKKDVHSFYTDLDDVLEFM